MNTTPVPRPSRRVVYGILALVVLLCLAAAIWWGISLWEQRRFENGCVYENVRYELGDERPDGQCVCAYGPEKWKWMWNCR